MPSSSIDSFIQVCIFNQVLQVEKLIKEGVDINGVNNVGQTGLMMAMMFGNTEVAAALLAHVDIKLDTTDIYGSTALHWACLGDEVESVKLFLGHPDCTKEVVKMRDEDGEAAAKCYSRECGKLIKEFMGDINDDIQRKNNGSHSILKLISRFCCNFSL